MLYILIVALIFLVMIILLLRLEKKYKNVVVTKKNKVKQYDNNSINHDDNTYNMMYIGTSVSNQFMDD